MRSRTALVGPGDGVIERSSGAGALGTVLVGSADWNVRMPPAAKTAETARVGVIDGDQGEGQEQPRKQGGNSGRLGHLQIPGSKSVDAHIGRQERGFRRRAKSRTFEISAWFCDDGDVPPEINNSARCDKAHIARHQGEVCRRAAALWMELTMLTALVLICSVEITPDMHDCTADNATAVIRVPAGVRKSGHVLHARTGLPG